MTRTTVALASAILLVAACSSPTASPGGGGATGQPTTGAGGTIKIGGGFALTGDESALDVPAANGAKLAVKEINAAGGVNGSQIDFIVHDSQYISTVAAQTAKQFVEQDHVPVMIGYTDTDSVIASGPTFQAAKVPFITIGATSPKIPTGGRWRRVLVQDVRPQRLLPLGQGRRVHDAPRWVLQDAIHGARRDDRARGFVRRQGDRLLRPDHEDQGAQPAAGLLLRRRDAVQHRPAREAIPRRRDHGPDRRGRRL
ncbi:MAG: ABC transporter substrate-binding protein [Chloroflexi bacterium]|nr:MAG: ABC transporter substrate-binding protein [Chloroflexota bacterium]